MNSDTITMQSLINFLSHCDPGMPVTIEGRGFCDGGIGSWRGSYADMTLHSTPLATEAVSAATLKETLKAAIGKEFSGYKGGEYECFPTSEVYADNQGEYTEHTIVGGRETQNGITLFLDEPHRTEWRTLADDRRKTKADELRKTISNAQRELDELGEEP